MSAKWRARQHRHRYTYSSTAFPDYFLESLKELLSDPASSSSKFPAELSHLTSLNTSYAQVATCNELSVSFSELLLRDSPAPVHFVSAAARLFLEVLFLENSLPLHRPVLSAVAKSRKSLPLLRSCFVQLCRQYGVGGERAGKKRFLVSRAALSLLGYPKLGFLHETLGECAVLVALDIAEGMKGVMNDVECGSRPSPAVMEQCQDAMSCLYYLFQRFPSSFACGKECSNVFALVLEATMGVLKSQAFSRDCLVASSVSFWAALQVYVTPEELTAFIAREFFEFRCADQVEDSDIKSLLPCNLDLRSGLGNVSTLSRLCLLRGMLTAIPRKLLNTHFEKSGSGAVWTVLYDAILPELCLFCENPIDSHFNFHALTVMQICLQQIKTSIMTDLIDYSVDYDPFPEGITSRIQRIAWNNLEDPLSQTVKQVHLIFDLFLDIQTKFHSGKDEQNKLFLCQIASKLLLLGPRCKGRYVPLASLTRRLGTLTLLEMNSKLLFETAQAYIDDDVCCAATTFLKCFLECLRDECWSCYGINMGYESFRGLCLPPILEGLVSEVSKLRTNLNTYALPTVLEVDVDSIFPMLSFIGVRPKREGISNQVVVTVNQCVAALVSLLKVSRLLALVEGDIDLDLDPETDDNTSDKFAIVCIKMTRMKVPVQWLELALTHAEESIRIDAAETLFLNPKTSTLPSKLELCLLRKAVPLNMRCCSTAFQMKWSSMFRKFFSRVKTALERQVKAGGWKLLYFSECRDDYSCSNNINLASNSAEELFCFMKWFSSHLFFSCYPSAPYERKTMAMELILIMLDVWPVMPPPTGVASIYPYGHEFTSPDSTLLLVGAIIDSWDRLRESSYHILLRFPTPLPGISCNNSVTEVITWAKRLVGSPRVRESDAGALALRLIFRKYVLDLGWIVGASSEVSCLVPQHELPNGNIQIIKPRKPVIEYLYSLVNWLQSSVMEGERDLSEACRNNFVHGILLTLRYAFEELDWSSGNILSSLSEMKSLLEKLLELVTRITSLALWVVSSDAWHFPDDVDDVTDNMDLLDQIKVETGTLESSLDALSDVSKPTDDVGPRDQIVMVGCWLAMKEVSLLLGTIVRKIPLPSHTDQDLPDAEFFAAENGHVHNTITPNAVLDLEQLEKLGHHFLQVLLKMKHNGAIDKTRAGFTALCNRLLSSNDPRLCKMVDTWLEILMERTIARGQTVDDLLRRSAGIPAAFIALFLSEPEGTPKKLLPRSLRWLIDVATNSVQTSSEINSLHNTVHKESSFEGFDGKIIRPISKMNSKVRDEGVVPTVHAFNVLRAAFNDTNLATDTSGFSAEALIISIRSFSSPYWEVRNSACLAYTALVRRMIGFLNVHKRESARRALTGLEFFHRYPALQPFLFSELKIATEALSYGIGEQMRPVNANGVHPSLCPILILLSRLKPSLVSTDPNDTFDPFLFMPFIQKCAAQNNLRVRVLASKALAGLVSNERLHIVVLTIANCLPGERSRVGEPMGGYSTYACDTNEKSEIPSSKTCFTSFNTIHGTLLLLSTLVEKNFINMTDISMKEEIIGQLMEILLRCSWIASIRKCPCPTLNSSFIYLLGNILDMAQRCNMYKYIVSTRNWLEELSSEYIGKEYHCGLTVYDPTEAELRRQAAISYFNCRFGGSQSQNVQDSAAHNLEERVVFCLSDSTYEVRLATLKSILQFLKHPDSSGDFYNQVWSKINLQPTLIQSLALERNRKCIYYTLRIIFIWNVLQSEKHEGLQVQKTASNQMMDRDSLISFWKKLVHLNTTVTHNKTREALLCCMAICVKQFTQLLRKTWDLQDMEAESATKSHNTSWAIWPNVYDYIGSFLLLVKKYGSASQPVNLRKSAAESIIASGLLREADFVAALVSNNEILADLCESEDFDEKCPCFISSKAAGSYAQKILDAWSTCISFLEDEDVGLRQKLAREINSFMKSRELKQADHSDVVPTQVENVMESCFEFLSSIFKHWMGYLDYLSGWALDTANSTVLSGDLVRQVFDKEIDNHHEEKLLICQICCLHIERILKSHCLFEPSSDMCRDAIAHLIQKWRSRFLRELTYFTSSCSKSVNKDDWVGGIGNHKDAFVPIYGNLLGLFALLPSPNLGLPAPLGPGHNFSFSDFGEIKLLMGPFLRNPLICNLYHLVLESHEASLGRSETNMDSEFRRGHSLWKEFDPYFLLR